MNQALKIQLLKRKFISNSYFEAFLDNYQQFIQIGIDAFEIYKKYRMNHPEYQPNKIVDTEEFFWEGKVIPNFKRMLYSAQKNQRLVKQNDPEIMMYMGSLAGDFRGLSRGFDGIREEFMDVKTPELRKQYRTLFKQTSRQATIIESTINGWWEDHEILNERITGPINEEELLNYLEPGESVE